MPQSDRVDRREGDGTIVIAWARPKLLQCRCGMVSLVVAGVMMFVVW